MIFGINTLLITSGSILPAIVFCIRSSCSIVAFKSFKSDSTISFTRFEEGVLNPIDLIALDRTTIEEFEYNPAPANPDIKKKLGKGDVAIINVFRLFVKFKTEKGKVTDDDWMRITEDEFNGWRISDDCTMRMMDDSAPPIPGGVRIVAGSASGSLDR